MTSIVGQLELLLDGELGPLTPRQKHAVRVMVRNADRLTALADDLATSLDLSRADAGEEMRAGPRDEVEESA